MLSYGFAKVFKTQFPFPNEMRLTETYGQSSPMGLVWTFMGYSPGYNYFTGGAEILAGVLLFFRRTTTYGSLVVITVISNIVMINFCYDVPVKLFSLHLLLMAVFILSFDLRRVVNFFFLNKSVSAVDFSHSFSNKSLKKSAFVIKIIAICFFFFITMKTHLDYLYKYPHSISLLSKGSYDVTDFKKNNENVIPGPDSPNRWKLFYISPEANYIAIRTDNDSVQYTSYSMSTADKTFSMHGYNYKDNIFFYEEPESGKLILIGKYNNDSLKIELRKKDGNYNLVNRGFHWINEYPFNR